MNLELTADDRCIQIRNVGILFLFQVVVIGFAYFTSGAYLFLGPQFTPPLYSIGIIAAISTLIVYALAITGVTERAYKKGELKTDTEDE